MPLFPIPISTILLILIFLILYLFYRIPILISRILTPISGILTTIPHIPLIPTFFPSIYPIFSPRFSISIFADSQNGTWLFHEIKRFKNCASKTAFPEVISFYRSYILNCPAPRNIPTDSIDLHSPHQFVPRQSFVLLAKLIHFVLPSMATQLMKIHLHIVFLTTEPPDSPNFTFPIIRLQ